jgi:hypothetical protein
MREGHDDDLVAGNSALSRHRRHGLLLSSSGAAGR